MFNPLSGWRYAAPLITAVSGVVFGAVGIYKWYKEQEFKREEFEYRKEQDRKKEEKSKEQK